MRKDKTQDPLCVLRLDLLTGAMQPASCEEHRNRILADKIIPNWMFLRLRYSARDVCGG